MISKAAGRIFESEMKETSQEAKSGTGSFPLLRQLFPCQIAEVCLLKADHSVIISKLPVQLSVADIYRIDKLCTVLRHAVGKTAGGGTDVHADLSGKIKRKNLQRLLEFESPAGYIAKCFSPDFNLYLFRIELRPRFVFLLPVYIYNS